MSETIKPCPFCRGNACCSYDGPTPEQVQNAISWGGDYDAYWQVECKMCLTSGRPFGDKEDAIAAWNRREA